MTWAFGLDGAMICVILFALFFAGLVFHLRREDKREGYPATAAAGSRRGGLARNILPMPMDKTFRRPHGRAPEETPRRGPRRKRIEEPEPRLIGRPTRPLLDGLAEGIGPAAWQDRHDEADLAVNGEPKIISMRRNPEYHVAPGDPDPRGWKVEGSDEKPAGEIVDLWFNRAEFFLRYLEVRPEGAPDRTVLLPVFFCNVKARERKVVMRSMPAARIAEAPGRRRKDRITLLEEDKVNAFFAGGWFYGRHPLGETTP